MISWCSFFPVEGAAKGQKKKKNTEKAAVMNQISTNKQGVKKQIRRLQAHNQTRKNKATVKDKQIKNALGEYFVSFINYAQK